MMQRTGLVYLQTFKQTQTLVLGVFRFLSFLEEEIKETDILFTVLDMQHSFEV